MCFLYNKWKCIRQRNYLYQSSRGHCRFWSFHENIFYPSHKSCQFVNLWCSQPVLISWFCLFWLSRWRSLRAWPIMWWWAACPAKCSTCSALFPRRLPWISTISGRWSWTWRLHGGTDLQPTLLSSFNSLNLFIQASFALSLILSLSFPVHLIRMTRHHPPVQFPNGCCQIRALLTRPLCGSRCFMWVTFLKKITPASQHSFMCAISLLHCIFAIYLTDGYYYCHFTGLFYFSCFPTALSVAVAPMCVNIFTEDSVLGHVVVACLTRREWMIAACMNRAVVLVAV